MSFGVMGQSFGRSTFVIGKSSSALRRACRGVVVQMMEALENRQLLSSTGPIVRPDHIVIVIDEDRASGAIGDVAHMPYFNQLAASGLVYTDSHGVAHPSLPDYLALYSGSTQGITDNGNNHTFSGPNLASLFNSTLIAPGQYLSLGGFAESLPHDGDMTTRISNDPNDPTSPPDLYMRNYNPMAQFTNVGNHAGVALTNAQVNKTFASFPNTAAGYASLPTVSFVIPNALHNTHGSNEQAPYATDPSEYNFLRSSADTWLKNNLDGYLQWAKANNSLLIITGDEEEDDSHETDTITTIVNGDPDLFVAGQNSNSINHFNLVRTIEDMYGLAPLGSTATAARLDTNVLGQLSPNSQTATTTVLNSSAATSVFEQSVTFTATVSSGAGAPTGSITFKDGTNVLGTGTLNASGIATFTTTGLAVASHAITAVYSGDTTFVTSTSASLSQTFNQASSATTITSSASSSVTGQSVTLTATVTAVAPGGGTRTGIVTFKDGATTLGTGTLDASGVATFSTSALSVASHSITAVYAGDTNFSSSISSSLTQLVNLAGTTTTVIAPAIVGPGQAVSFSASIALIAPGAGMPTGTIQFKIDGVNFGLPMPLLSGSASSSSINTLAAGNHTITATYSGDSGFGTSSGSASMQVVALNSTSTTLSSAPNPSVSGQSVLLTATVHSAAGTPTGVVTFFDGATTLGMGTLNASAVATFSTTTLAVASHSITAVYGGDSAFATSTSAALVHQVVKASTATTLASAPNPSVFGQSVVLTATVTITAPGAGTPAGSVTFMDGATVLGTGTLNSSGVATFSTSALAVASHSITGVYGGNASLSTSTSAALAHVVNKAPTTATITSSTNPASISQSITFTATIAVVAPGAGIPAGTVQFVIDGTNFGSAITLVNGSATSAATSFAAAGTHTIKVVYAGNASFAIATSTNLTQTVAASNNNNFANRTVLTGTSITTTANNATATKETGEPKHAGNAGGKSLWWTWTAPSSGSVTIDTAGSNFDTLLAVYTGSSVSALTAVTGGSSDDASSTVTTSKATFNVTAGTVYQIAVDGYAGASGNITLHLNLGAAAAPAAPTNVAATDGAFNDKVRVTWTAVTGATAYEVWRSTTNSSASATKISATDITTATFDDTTAVLGTTYFYWVKAKNTGGTSAFSASDSGYRIGTNDAFANRIVLTGASVTTTGTNAGATKETGEPAHAGNAGGKSVWWTWTAPASGTVTIDTTGSTFDTLLAVYTGSSVTALTAVTGGSNDDNPAGGMTTSKVTFSVTAGTVYQIAVDGYAAAAGSITLHINLV
jgi:hypothetical protein